ncbi:MAG: tetratricopeptide repeat protein, partial [Patescibacteria group bacterium]
NDDYLRSLALIRIEQIKNILNRAAGAEIDEQTKQVLGALANSAIEAGRAAVEINSADFQNFEALGKAYEGLIPLVGNASERSLEAYQKAADLNPKGPAHLLNKARVSLISYDNYSSQAQGKSGEELNALVKKQKDALNDAENLLKKSLELKQNYSEAYLALAQVYERQDKTGEAIRAAESAVLANPEGTGELFQLGYLYYKQSRFSDAKIVFQKLANLYPTYSNGRYFLGLIYDKIGDKKAAVSEFEIVSALNPDNAEVKKILENLRASRPAFEAAVPENPLEKK